jgi:hypothetical protein
MKVNNVKNPKWADFNHSVIECEVDFEELDETYVSFGAVASGDVDHTHEIFSRCIAGEFGAVAAYVPSPPYIRTPLENKTEAERRLVATDWVNQPDVYDPASTPHLTNRDAYLTYRSAIRSIAVSPTEGTLEWPTEPTAVWSV